MDLEKQLRACEGGKGDLVPALLWWGGVRLMSYPWTLLALFLGAQATCETPGCQRYLVYKDKAWGILNLLWLFRNVFYEQGLVLIWLRIREFWEWKATVDLAFGSQARLAIMAGSSFSGLVGSCRGAELRQPCGR